MVIKGEHVITLDFYMTRLRPCLFPELVAEDAALAREAAENDEAKKKQAPCDLSANKEER